MKLIKIIPESIKKNKNAGSTSTMMRGQETIEFSGEGTIPAWMLDQKSAIITCAQRIGDGIYSTIHFEGLLVDLSRLQQLREMPNMSISISTEMQQVAHAPIPQYSYEYEDIELTCEECKSEVKMSEIKTEYGYMDGDPTEICPRCGVSDTFEYVEYQTIRGALNGKK